MRAGLTVAISVAKYRYSFSFKGNGFFDAAQKESLQRKSRADNLAAALDQVWPPCGKWNGKTMLHPDLDPRMGKARERRCRDPPADFR